MNIHPMFIHEASEVLGKTNEGLTGTEIANKCRAYAMHFNVTIEYYNTGLIGTAPNKRTALKKILRNSLQNNNIL